MRLLDDQAAALLERIAADLRAGELTVERWSVTDTDALSVVSRFVAGEAAITRAAVAEVEGRRAASGMDHHAAPHAPTEACPACGVLGTLRDAGGLARLCIACNAETTPIPTPATGG